MLAFSRAKADLDEERFVERKKALEGAHLALNRTRLTIQFDD